MNASWGLSRVVFGHDRGRGMLLGVEPVMETSDYLSVESFARALSRPLEEARAAGWLGPKTIAVFPENTGTWLVALGAPEPAAAAERTTDAARTIARRHLLRFSLRFARSRAADRATDALLRLKAGAMAAAYQQAFGRLARRLGITVAAGTIVLPEPRVHSGTLECGRGRLRNVCAVFDPDGSVRTKLVMKCHPTASELPFVGSGSEENLPAFDTPAGRLGVLICADSWYPACWQRLRDLGVEIVAVPSHVGSDEQWYGAWQGYSGWPAPPDVDVGDIGRITEAEAWLKYAMAGRIASCGARCGITVLLRGHLWDLGPGGRSTVVRDGEVSVVREGRGAASERSGGLPSLVGCWL